MINHKVVFSKKGMYKLIFLTLGDENREQRERRKPLSWRHKYRNFGHKDSRPIDLKVLIQINKILVIRCYNIQNSAKYHDLPHSDFTICESVITICPLLSCAKSAGSWPHTLWDHESSYDMMHPLEASSLLRDMTVA